MFSFLNDNPFLSLFSVPAKKTRRGHKRSIKETSISLDKVQVGSGTPTSTIFSDESPDVEPSTGEEGSVTSSLMSTPEPKTKKVIITCRNPLLMYLFDLFLRLDSLVRQLKLKVKVKENCLFFVIINNYFSSSYTSSFCSCHCQPITIFLRGISQSHVHWCHR